MSQPVNIWTGKLVRLRAIEPGDWEQFHRWDMDTDSQRSGYRVTPTRSREGQRKWAEAEAVASPDSDRFRFAIETLAGVLVGSMNIHDADTVNGTFEYGVSVGREHWGNGYAGDAIAIALRFMFRERRYQKANATVYAFNDASIALHRKLGFVEEGRIRRNHFADGQYHDELWFGMTAEEFEEHLAGRL
jgi:RimJ/RimL family protein N-acetyltransferase